MTPQLRDIRIAAEDAKTGFVFNRPGITLGSAVQLIPQQVAGFSATANLLISQRFFNGMQGLRPRACESGRSQGEGG